MIFLVCFLSFIVGALGYALFHFMEVNRHLKGDLDFLSKDPIVLNRLLERWWDESERTTRETERS